MEVFKELKQEAIECGMCEKFQQEWENPDIEMLCRYFHRGQDFCIEHNFPSVEFLKRYEYEIIKYGIYVGNVSTRSKHHMVALGDADVCIDVRGICDLTIRHNARVELSLRKDSYCYISAYDDCEIIVLNKEEGSRLCMSYWGGEILLGKDKFDKIINKTR